MKQLMQFQLKQNIQIKYLIKQKNISIEEKNIGWKNCNKKMFVYSSEVEKTIVGYIVIENILERNIDYILKTINNKNNVEIIKYFSSCDKWYTLKIVRPIRLKKNINLNEIKSKEKNFVVSQFYCYIKKMNISMINLKIYKTYKI